jgi:HEAT repeat protein
MSRFPWLNKKLVATVAILVLLLLGGVAWLERTPILSWYYVRSLAKADDNNRDAWVERVAGLGEDAVPPLLSCLKDTDPNVCRNARAALMRLSQAWGLGDSRTVALAMRCGGEFTQLSAPGQQNVLDLAAEWFRSATEGSPPAPGLLAACVRFLQEAITSTDCTTQERALGLCDVLLTQPQGTEALSASRELVRNCLASENVANRLRAVEFAKRPGMDLFEQVASLLNDPVVEVRRAAVAAVGAAANVVLDDALLPSLHDDDPEVQRLCWEALLVQRQLTPEQIRLGYLLTAKEPVVRIQVVDYLHKVADLKDPALWLTRLSHDSSPAIRAAAARAMSRFSTTDQSMVERLDEMARTDPSATVCLLAKYYLENPENRAVSKTVPKTPNGRMAKSGTSQESDARD